MTAQYLTFIVDGQIFGLPIEKIREINSISDITKVPNAPPHVVGVMNLRGKIIPVADLNLRLNGSQTVNSKETCTIVVDFGSGQVGLIVDAVNSVTDIEEASIDRNPVNQEGRNYISGVAPIDSKLVLLMDIDSCLSEESNESVLEVAA
ncbi:chemotaxis protein CheW [Bdellovibrio sp. HCB274]|uniref:chemotaxis protein CheW n=1 Tax=Bdellovibrio sp. HCB274 TaxID=3394361 RepID=UPI0039B6443E